MSARGRLFVAVIVGALALTGVWALREATESRHVVVAADSQLEVVVDAEARQANASQSLHELTAAQVLACRLEVNGDPVSDITPLAGDPTRFRFVVQPSLDRSDRRQFRGCLEDWRNDHLRVRVVEMRDLARLGSR